MVASGGITCRFMINLAALIIHQSRNGRKTGLSVY
jgi:hypothetical protein